MNSRAEIPGHVGRPCGRLCIGHLFALLALLLSVQAHGQTPAAPVIVGVSPDTGTPNDGITSATLMTIDGTAEPNHTIAVRLRYSSNTLGTTTSDNAGHWSFVYSNSGSPLGSLDFFAKAINGAGVSSAEPQPFVLWLASPAKINGFIRRAEVGRAVDYPMDVTGAWPFDLTITVAGLPPGLSFGENRVRGVPTTAGAYRVVVTAQNGAGSDQKAFTLFVAPAAGDPSTEWQSRDIGTSTAGSTNYGSGTTVLRGSGVDIWDTADGFRYHAQALNGDGTITARISHVDDTHGWAKAGVMIREANDPGARNVFVAVTPSWNGITAQSRSSPGGTTTSVPGPGTTSPYWVRIARAGNTFTAASSPDGVTWTPITTFNVPMSATASYGFAVTSHDNTKLNEAVFADPFVGTR